ncbi:hypothetical protein H696_03367 [Fonticula alba]|uniref:Uncharacterized protein n=1 Tax=Fonticula alba TaxID=691883 RepID=A0A058Z6L4_FONAL|nr:hypothetical protein H696_03367 [Fonticula alba]KCV69900.1 hypothetical protein H696_03367 [Fonticula alba]|eukprot:XP_009495506.1 hypothetical protein H696_03367 [Fonticula alba]
MAANRPAETMSALEYSISWVQRLSIPVPCGPLTPEQIATIPPNQPPATDPHLVLDPASAFSLRLGEELAALDRHACDQNEHHQHLQARYAVLKRTRIAVIEAARTAFEAEQARLEQERRDREERAREENERLLRAEAERREREERERLQRQEQERQEQERREQERREHEERERARAASFTHSIQPGNTAPADQPPKINYSEFEHGSSPSNAWDQTASTPSDDLWRQYGGQRPPAAGVAAAAAAGPPPTTATPQAPNPYAPTPGPGSTPGYPSYPSPYSAQPSRPPQPSPYGATAGYPPASGSSPYPGAGGPPSAHPGYPHRPGASPPGSQPSPGGPYAPIPGSHPSPGGPYAPTPGPNASSSPGYPPYPGAPSAGGVPPHARPNPYPGAGSGPAPYAGGPPGTGASPSGPGTFSGGPYPSQGNAPPYVAGGSPYGAGGGAGGAGGPYGQHPPGGPPAAPYGGPQPVAGAAARVSRDRVLARLSPVQQQMFLQMEPVGYDAGPLGEAIALLHPNPSPGSRADYDHLVTLLDLYGQLDELNIYQPRARDPSRPLTEDQLLEHYRFLLKAIIDYKYDLSQVADMLLALG